MKAGTRVKLTAKAVKARHHGYLNRHISKNWATRRGVVRHIGKEGRVYVIWEGNKNPEQLQLIEVEGCDD